MIMTGLLTVTDEVVCFHDSVIQRNTEERQKSAGRHPVAAGRERAFFTECRE